MKSQEDGLVKTYKHFLGFKFHAFPATDTKMKAEITTLKWNVYRVFQVL